MGLRLVDDDLDVSFDIPMRLEARLAFTMQLQRVAQEPDKPQFERRLCHLLQQLLDADLQPPTQRQVAYALAIAKALDIGLPGEALRHRGSMWAFLERYDAIYKQRTESDV